jgi:transcriptional regulator with XRE-family HTH domain
MDAAQLIRQARQRHALISAYERGHRDPSTGTLRRLLAAAGERLDLRLAPSMPAIPPPADPEEHGERLLDVLLLADAIGHRTRPPLSFPRIESA